MKILVLGGTGMLGHQLVKSLSANHEVYASGRNALDARDGSLVCLRANMDWYRPEIVLNAVGVIPQRPTHTESTAEMIEVNALFPHKLAKIACQFGARLIHFSTDCVFSGRKGNYDEYDLAAPTDLYGRTKLLGEVTGEGCLTLRTSIIGRELQRKSGLLEWFLAQQHGHVDGFVNARFSGLTTIELARVVERVITHNVEASGIWHVGGDLISKYHLLLLLKKHYGLTTNIVAEEYTKCDRSLDSRQFNAVFNYIPPTWRQMISELK